MIGGKTALAVGTQGWTLTVGVIPHVRAFDLSPNDAAQLAERSTPVTLVIGTGDTEVEFENLYVIGEVPGSNEHLARILVADRRYWWTYASITRRFNVRRHVGHKRIAADDTRELTDVTKDAWYAPYSLPGGDPDAEPWTGPDAFDSVMSEVMEHEPGVPGSNEVIRDGTLKFDAVPFENVEIQDNGADAVRRVLAHMPDAEITLDPKGRVHLISVADGRGEDLVDEVEADGLGHLAKVTRANIRPSAIHVRFHREIEARVDFEEVAKGDTSARDPDDIWSENVLGYPDYTGTLAGGEEVVRGTWVTFPEALASWEETPLPVFGVLELDDIRAASVPFMDLWGLARLSGQAQPDVDWASRISAVMSNYRRTFRINRRVIDRIHHWAPYRIATINPEDGTRAPATVYADYAIIPGQRFLVAQAAGEGDLSWCVNVAGYPSGGDLDSTANAAPARLEVVDHDQGVFHVNWSVDPSRSYEQTLPSMVTIRGNPSTAAGVLPDIPGPSGDLTDKGSPISFNCVTERGAVPEFVKAYKMAAIITVSPASPNNDDQYQTVVVKPDDVRDLLPAAMAEGLDKCRGPVLEIIVGRDMETARVRWSDDDRETIYGAIGIRNDEEDGRLNPDALAALTVNLDDDFGGAASLNRIARALAAASYATYADRVIGTAGVRLMPGYYPRGRVDSVEVAVGAGSGVVTTNLNLPDFVRSPSLFSMLPNSTRRLLMRLATPGKN